ncbi:MAG: serine hydrolase [Bacteroidales bacterium]|nr:serine hydrolase [Bacteroidales bacterium]
MKKRILYATGLTIFVGLSWGIIYLYSLLPIITGYPAKYLCSAVFISERDPNEVKSSELNFSFIRFVTNHVDYEDKTVTSRFLWNSSTAIYRECFGSTLLYETDVVALKKKKFPTLSAVRYKQDSVAWPLGNIIPDTNTGIDKNALARIAHNLIVSHSYKGDVFAFMVVHKGFPVIERYKEGFTNKTRFLSWSMAKSVNNALAGIMVGDGILDIHEKADIKAWQNDERNQITINDLMQMQSGLSWNEDYGNRSDVTLMLYNSGDFARFAINRPSAFPAGSHWYYSSGSTNIVNYLMRKKFDDDSAYYSFPYAQLFNKIGMPDAVFETDPSGTLAGSSYLFATARDYARFGLLYLQDGIFNGERILPEGWVGYSTTPALHSNGNYGSFFWLNRGKYYLAAPDDMYSCNGHDGQRIFIIPSCDLIVVILGYSPKNVNELKFNMLLKDILESVNHNRHSRAQ